MIVVMKREQERAKIDEAPCKNCKDRTMTCHDDCERYIAFARLRDEKLSKKRAEEASVFTERFTKNLLKHRRNNL